MEIARATTPWRAEKGGPLRAGVNAFGVGGINAFILLESHENVRDRLADAGRRLFPFSAKNESGLRRAAAAFLTWLDGADRDADLGHVAHTLQTGRDAMSCRFVVVAANHAGLRDALSAYLENRAHADLYRVDSVSEQANHDKTAPTAVAKPQQLARFWVNGGALDWSELALCPGGKRVPLPGYPFERRAFPLPGRQKDADQTRIDQIRAVQPSVLAPTLKPDFL